MRLTATRFLSLLLAARSAHVAFSSSTPLMEATTGKLSLPATLDAPGDNLVAVITSPGTPDSLCSDDEAVLSWDPQNRLLQCRGATLRGTSAAERQALAMTGAAATTLVVEGITAGDAQELTNSRHARTLTALVRAAVQNKHKQQQKLVLVVVGDNEASSDKEQLLAQVQALYEAAAVEQKDSAPLEEAFEVQIVTKEQAKEMIAKAASTTTESSTSLTAALTQADSWVRTQDVASQALDTPQIATAFLAVHQATTAATRRIQAATARWKARTARGLLVDHFGTAATTLQQSVMQQWDVATRVAAGVAVVGPLRQEQRQAVKNLLQNSIAQAYQAQLDNLQTTAQRRLQKKLLQIQANAPVSADKSDARVQALRQECMRVEDILDDLQLNDGSRYTKEKALPELTQALQMTLAQFADSAVAKLQRAQQVSSTVNKEKKPTERSVQVGLDLVAMLRPDGFGSLQGYAGYQLMGGNSITFGIHNDADDPQTIAQFGGVRPPLLRVQPKLRVEVEL